MSINKYTTQEVLNKVYTDESDNTISLQAQTAKETLNAVLSSGQNSLNVSLAGSNTITGDVTISGDLTVNGTTGNAYDEIVNGDLHVKSDSGDSTDAFLVEKNDGTDVFIVDTTNSKVSITDTLNLNPTISSGSKTSLAFQRSGANKWRFIQPHDDSYLKLYNDGASATQMYFASNNNVGIGTASPSVKLQVEESTNGADVQINMRALNDGGAGRTTAIKFDPDARKMHFGEDLSNLVLDTSNVRVGIGCDHPSVPLEVELSGDTGTYFEGGGSGNDASDLRHLTITASTTSSAGDTHTLNAESGSGVLKFATSGSDRMTINSTGVGIGTASPSKKLEVAGDIKLLNGTNNITVFYGGDNWGQRVIYSTGNMDFFTNGANRLSITGAGSVGIGTDSPNKRLHVHEPSAGSSHVAFTNTDTGLTTEFIVGITSGEIAEVWNENNTPLRFATNDTERMRIASDGKVGINEDSPDKELHLKGSEPTFRIEQTADSGKYFDIQTGTGGGVGKLKFSSEAVSNTLVIGNNARVGINNGAPTETLDVTGNALISGDVSVIKGTTSSTQNVMGVGKAGNIESSGGGSAFLTVHGNTNNQRGQIELGSDNLVGDGTIMGRVFFYNLDGGSSVVSRAQISAMRDSADDASKLVFATEPTSGDVTDNFVLDGNSRISLSNNDSGTSNTIFGKSAGASLDAGSNYNTFIGENVADATLDDATYNVGIGYNALTDLTTADSNVVIGALAGENITTGNENTIIGTGAFRQGATGYDNVAIGRECMGLGYVEGHDNVAVGKGSAYDLTTGNDNTFLGRASGGNVTTGEGNTFAGYQSGNTGTVDIEGGNYNTFIGYQARGSNASAINQIVIGKTAQGQGNNSVTLGNADVTAVYMAQDATSDNSTNTEGATVYAKGLHLKQLSAHDSGGMDTPLILHSHFNDTPSGGQGTGLLIRNSADDDNSSEDVAKIGFLGGSGTTATNLGGDISFSVIGAGTLTEIMTLNGTNGYFNATVKGNTPSGVTRFGLNVENDGDQTTSQGIEIKCGKDTLGADGDAIWLGLKSGDGDDIASIRYVHSGVTAGIVATSDERLKENIKDTSIKGLDSINALQLREFNWKSEVNRGSEKIKAGLIAQEVEKIDDIKSMVTSLGKFGEKLNDKGEVTQEAILNDAKGIEWSSTIPFLIKAVQELSAKVTELENK